MVMYLLSLKSTDVTSTEITRAPIAEVYDFIVNDMLFATQHLPAVWGSENRARPTADAAQGYAGKSLYYNGNSSDERCIKLC